MNTWTIYPSLQDNRHFALGSPGGRELRRGEAVDILLGGFRIPGYIEYDPKGDYFLSRTGNGVCGLYAGMKIYLTGRRGERKIVAPPVGTSA